MTAGGNQHGGWTILIHAHMQPPWTLSGGEGFFPDRSFQLRVVYELHGKTAENKAFKLIADHLSKVGEMWLKPVAHPSGKWILDLDAITEKWKGRLGGEGLKGKVFVVPHFDHSQKVVKPAKDDIRIEDSTTVTFEYPCDDAALMPKTAPPELRVSLEAFVQDHPSPAITAFVMMRFTDTPLHSAVYNAVKEECEKVGVKVLRADEKDYTEELWLNICTYMHGCGFGIALFERISHDDFNPNVSLEVGYMLGMGKPVLLLKDKSLKSIHTDLVGRLYIEFDTQNPAVSIGKAMGKWLRDRNIISN